jgi:hypothetical protein
MKGGMNMLKKSFFVVFVVSVLVLASAMVYAQKGYKESIGHAGNLLLHVESLVGQVESQKLISQSISKDLEDSLHDYAKEFMAAFEGALAEGKSFAESKGKSGAIASLQEFEKKTGPEQQKRVKSLESRTIIINDKIPRGEIMYDRSIVSQMSGKEIDDFQASLTPAAREKYRKTFPDIFKSPDPAGAGPWEESRESIFVAASLPGEMTSSSVVSGGGAAALACAAPCVAQNWPSCISCLVNAGLKGIEIANQFDSCWDDCAGKSTKWKRFWCRVGCVAVLIAKIL